jgi:hypothetical protein
MIFLCILELTSFGFCPCFCLLFYSAYLDGLDMPLLRGVGHSILQVIRQGAPGRILTLSQAREVCLISISGRLDAVPFYMCMLRYVYNPQDFGVSGDENYNADTQGTPDFKCSNAQVAPNFSGGTKGTIADRNQELAGPKSADGTTPGGGNTYVPCAYQAPSTLLRK